MLSMLKKFINLIANFLTVVSSLLLLGIVFCVILAVLNRAVIKTSMFWTEEMARILFVWFSMLAPGIIAAKESQFRMNYFSDRIFKGRMKTILKILTDIMVCFVLIAFTRAGFELTVTVLPQKLPSIRAASMSWLYAALPVGMAVITFITACLILDKIISLIHFKDSQRNTDNDKFGGAIDGF